MVRRAKAEEAAADGDDLPYRVYTTAFDVEWFGYELEAVIAASGNDTQPGRISDPGHFESADSEFDKGYSEGRAQLGSSERHDFSDCAILLLLDQSGSMIERMPRTAGAILAAMEALERTGASTMFAGFTTVGWQGGKSRKSWLRARRPLRPGRLCDLLYVTYSPFGSATASDDFAPLLASSVCFENVDGEALLWAREKLIVTPEEGRILIVLSDGAPVDDSTLAVNDNAILWRHLHQVVEALQEDALLSLGAVGLGYRVDTLYDRSRFVDSGGEIAAAIIDLAAELRSVSST